MSDASLYSNVHRHMGTGTIRSASSLGRKRYPATAIWLIRARANTCRRRRTAFAVNLAVLLYRMRYKEGTPMGPGGSSSRRRPHQLPQHRHDVDLVCGSSLPAILSCFLFAYAVLGPEHYLTEISWLHKRGYFTRGKYDFLLLGGLALPGFVLGRLVWSGLRPNVTGSQPRNLHVSGLWQRSGAGAH